jgi:hypothetical protein
MYSGMLPKTGAGLAVGGVFLSTLDLMWVGIGIAVVGGALVTLSKFGPRIAVDAVPYGVRGTRYRLTYNGRPIFRRHR